MAKRRAVIELWRGIGAAVIASALHRPQPAANREAKPRESTWLAKRDKGALARREKRREYPAGRRLEMRGSCK